MRNSCQQLRNTGHTQRSQLEPLAGKPITRTRDADLTGDIMEDTDGSNEEGDLDDGVACAVKLLILSGGKREIARAKVIVGDIAIVRADEFYLACG